jgi:hypothetical protein
MDSIETLPIPEDVNELISQWISIANEYAASHLQEAITLKKRHTRIGTLSVIISAVIGTSIFAGIQAGASGILQWVFAILTMAAAALAAVVTFKNYAERAGNHKATSEEYADIARQLEILKASVTTMKPDEWRNVLEGYSQDLDAIGRRAELPSSMIDWDKIAMDGATAAKRRAGSKAEVRAKRREKAPVPIKLPFEGFYRQLVKLYAVAVVS